MMIMITLVGDLHGLARGGSDVDDGRGGCRSGGPVASSGHRGGQGCGHLVGE
jgi:hypothetical protein